MNSDQKAAAVLIAGYLRGLWSRISEQPDQLIVQALKKLQVPRGFLPVPEPQEPARQEGRPGDHATQ